MPCRAQGETETSFYWGDSSVYSQMNNYAWYELNTYDQNQRYAHIVGLKSPNDWHLYDMSGNAWEWCQDWFGSYPSSAVIDPVGPLNGTAKVFARWCDGSAIGTTAAPPVALRNLTFLEGSDEISFRILREVD